MEKESFEDPVSAEFMNEAFVNSARGPLPSYDVGGAVKFDTGPWSLRGVVMNVGENDDGNSFMFAGAQAGYTVYAGLRDLDESRPSLLGRWTARHPDHRLRRHPR